MPSLQKMDNLYMDVAIRVAEMSHARRLKVGSVITKNDNIIAYGWNGTPAGTDNNCEDELSDGSLVTRKEVLHSESNAIAKLVSIGGVGAEGSTLYVTYSPCPECAKLIKQSKIKRVVYLHEYRLTDGIDLLRKLGVEVHRHGNENVLHKEVEADSVLQTKIASKPSDFVPHLPPQPSILEAPPMPQVPQPIFQSPSEADIAALIAAAGITDQPTPKKSLLSTVDEGVYRSPYL